MKCFLENFQVNQSRNELLVRDGNSWNVSRLVKFFELRVENQENETNPSNSSFIDFRDHKYEYSVVPTTLRLNTLYVNVYLIFMNLVVNGKGGRQSGQS